MSGETAGGPRTGVDDMREPATENTPQFISRFIHAIKTEPPAEPMLALFERLDGDANVRQRRHIFRAKWGILFGTAALLLSIVQLSFPPPTEENGSVWHLLPELILVGGTAIFVLPELSPRGHEHWLLSRYRAEQLRLAKWKLFIEPGLATRTAASLAADIQSEVVRNEIHDASELQERARHEAAAAIPRGQPSGTDLRELLDYYVGNRLAAQIGYFHRKSQEKEGLLTNPVLMPTFFLVTLGFVVLHFVFEVVHFFIREKPPIVERFGFVFALIAALLAAALAGVRTWKSALEATRNTTRACAKENALATYRRSLQNEAIGPFEAFAILACCESLFAQEQGEWLRLMLEAESYM